MQLSAQHIEQLKRQAVEEAGQHARLRLFDSRLDDAAVGGEVDLLPELGVPMADPALRVARMAARAQSHTPAHPRSRLAARCRVVMSDVDGAGSDINSHRRTNLQFMPDDMVKYRGQRSPPPCSRRQVKSTF